MSFFAFTIPKGLRRTVWCAAALVAIEVLPSSLLAQGLTNRSAAEYPSTAARASKAEMVPPLPPSDKPPVEFFRELLAMDSVERNAALANRTAEDRDQILAKILEYRA